MQIPIRRPFIIFGLACFTGVTGWIEILGLEEMHSLRAIECILEECIFGKLYLVFKVNTLCCEGRVVLLSCSSACVMNIARALPGVYESRGVRNLP